MFSAHSDSEATNGSARLSLLEILRSRVENSFVGLEDVYSIFIVEVPGWNERDRGNGQWRAGTGLGWPRSLQVCIALHLSQKIRILSFPALMVTIDGWRSLQLSERSTADVKP